MLETHSTRPVNHFSPSDRARDRFYAILETLASRLHSWAWRKRWGSRATGRARANNGYSKAGH